MAEELGPWQAMQRSWGLVRGHFWRVLGLNILALMVVGIVSLALATPLQALTLSGSSLTAIQVTSQISNAIAYALTLPFQALLAAVIYFDLRVRKEAFDLEALAMGLDEVKQVPPAPPIPPQPDFGDSTPPMDDDRPPPPTDWDDPGSDPFS